MWESLNFKRTFQILIEYTIYSYELYQILARFFFQLYYHYRFHNCIFSNINNISVRKSELTKQYIMGFPKWLMRYKYSIKNDLVTLRIFKTTGENDKRNRSVSDTHSLIVLASTPSFFFVIVFISLLCLIPSFMTEALAATAGLLPQFCDEFLL